MSRAFITHQRNMIAYFLECVAKTTNLKIVHVEADGEIIATEDVPRVSDAEDAVELCFAVDVATIVFRDPSDDPLSRDPEDDEPFETWVTFNRMNGVDFEILEGYGESLRDAFSAWFERYGD